MEAGWLLAAAAVPLYFNIYTDRSFESDKIIVLRTFVLIMLVAWLVKLFETGKAARNTGLPKSESFWTSRQTLVYAILGYMAAYILATITSVAPLTSLWGSYSRFEGVTATLSYAALFFLIAFNLRTRAQLNRLINLILLVSLPICLYGIAQQWKMDPLPGGGDPSTLAFPVHSTMGHHIFVSAYLIMVVPLTLARLSESFSRYLESRSRPQVEDNSRPASILGYLGLIFLQNAILFIFVYWGITTVNLWWGALAGVLAFVFLSLFMTTKNNSAAMNGWLSAGYLGLFLVQVFTVMLSQARGPWLGLFAGVLTFILIFSFRRGLRNLKFGTAAAALLIVLFVMLLNMPASPLSSLKSAPALSRLSNLFEIKEGSGGARLDLWQEVANLMWVHPSVGFSSDPISILRPVVGYGPETMSFVFQGLYSEQLGDGWDRAHNDYLNQLVASGLLGLLTYLLVIGLFFWHGFRFLRRANSLYSQAIMAACMAVIVATLVESLTGIGVAATRTYFWLAIAVGVVLPQLDQNKAAGEAPAAGETSNPKPIKAAKGKKRKVASPPSPKQGRKIEGRLYWTIVYFVLFGLGMIILRVLPEVADINYLWLPSVGFVVVGLFILALGLDAIEGLRSWRVNYWWVYLTLLPILIFVLYFNLSFASADVDFKIGRISYERGDLLNAIPAFQRAINHDPEEAHYYANLAAGFFELAKIAQAKDSGLQPTLDRIRALKPEDLYALGPKDLLACAVVGFNEAVRLEPLNADHYDNRAILYSYWGGTDPLKFDLALEDYRKEAILRPKIKTLYSGWARALALKAKALADDSKALAAKGDTAAADQKIAQAKSSASEALEKGQKAFSLGWDRRDWPSHEILATAQDVLGKEEALKEMAIAITYAPDDKFKLLLAEMAKMSVSPSIIKGNLIQNGDFADLEKGSPFAWNIELPASIGAHQSSGSALGFSGPSQQRMSVSQKMVVTENTTYSLSFDYKNKLTSGSQVIFVEFFDKEGKLTNVTPEELMGITLPPSSEWAQFTYQFTTPPGTICAAVWLRGSGVGEAWYASVSFSPKSEE